MKQKLGGLSLERFAKAKQSGYDKKAKKAKELALNAKKVNKYRKLKQKLAAKGLLAPRFAYEEKTNLYDAQTGRPRSDEAAMERIYARAGPAPDSAGESGEDEMLGPESDSDSGNPAAEHRTPPLLQLGMQPRHHLEQQKDQRLMPRSPLQDPRSLHHIDASQNAAGAEEETADPGRHQPEASAAGERNAYKGRAGSIRAESKHEEHPGHEEGHRAEAQLGQKQKRGKKRKPATQLQRVQAEVQAKKEAEQREREERRMRIEEHASKVAEAERQRKQHTKMLRKRTHQGQPVMRYRMDKILGQLQAEAAQT